MAFPETLKGLRIRAGLSARELGLLAGLAASHVGLLESGSRTDVGADTVAKLAKVLATTLDHLVLGIGEPPTDEELADAVAAARARRAEPDPPSENGHEPPIEAA